MCVCVRACGVIPDSRIMDLLDIVVQWSSTKTRHETQNHVDFVYVNEYILLCVIFKQYVLKIMDHLQLSTLTYNY